ncbi:SusC/RagA family TonB-linked outer membrane protein [Hymenobacter psychrophilus]|uniref:TonB-linked outer membrane protein, SusC/RagA family n=1 Tax=Hymenobacter psychrophilus TaxID=651662 RepID=A0A1H3HK33_9BACT|nr:SusC/RagA family TonB-linked outer membrane protein [Hymenobacter psychrophilus]SDY15847.1 TonB-linked outer membrane protein, SusC/RagA family [Hymenobacter psychrophilus]
MVRLLPFSFLLPLSLPALAQRTDTVRLRDVHVTDSVTSVVTSCPVQILVSQYQFSPFLPLQEQLRQVAGVQATPYSGAPGVQVAVRIRGAASLGIDAQPLYVVDGMPVFQNTFRPNAGSSIITLVPAEVQELDNNPLLSIPTEDIAQVEVLKGGYETALYGSQGLNGVIRITTRRGQAGKPRLSYSGYGGVQHARTRYDLLDAREYATLRNEVAQRFNQPAPYSAAQLADLGRGTDWQDEVLRTAAVQEHHLGLSGGTATTRYYAAADYLNQEGVVLNSRLRRYAVRTALNQQIGQHLRLEATGGFSQTEQRVPNYNVVQEALFTPPTQSPTDNPRPGYYVNPLDRARQSYQTPEQQRLLAQLGAHYEVATGLTVDLRANLERATLRSRSYRAAFGPIPGGQNGDLTFTYRQLTLNPALRYARSFGGARHAVTASLEALRQSRQTTTEQSTYTPGTAANVPGGGGSSSRSAGEAGANFYQLTAGYTFAERYQVLGTLRADASSAFAPDNRWSWLPGAQVRWHAAKENFWTAAPGKLDVWVGWGRTSGAGNFGRNSFLIPVPNGGNLSQTAPLFLPDPSQQLDAGLEAGLLNNRLTVTAQAYARRTTVSPSFSGFPSSPSTTDNVYLRNTGLELTVQGSWQAGQLAGSSQLAAAANRNRFVTGNATSYNLPYQRTLDGQSIATFYGYRTRPLGPTGTLEYEDTNGDGRVDFQDQQPLGSGLPRQLLSFTQQLTLGRLEAQLQADGMFGYQVNNTALLELDAPRGDANASGRVRNRWTPTNPATDVPVAGSRLLGGGVNPGFSTYTLQSGNHVRLSAVTVSYKVWERDARNVRLWLGGQNLLVLTKYRGYDPNVSSAGSNNQQAGLDAGAYPTARTVLLGLRATL